MPAIQEIGQLTVDLKGGQVIAIDQDGRPALIANSYGKGKALLCTYPVESYLAQAPAAFERAAEFI